MKNHVVQWSAVCLMVLGAAHSWSTEVRDEALLTDESPLQLNLEVPAQWLALDDAALDALRGGFDIGNGLRVSFGFMRSIAINGEQVSQTSFHFPDLQNITPDQARIAGEAMSQAGVIQVGRHNVVAASDAIAQSALSGATIVQNSLNNQHISSLTEINTAVNSMGLIKSMNAQSALQEALLGSLNVR